jgi:hypothetical protein
MSYRKRLRKARKRLQLLRPKFRLFVLLMRHRHMRVDVLFRKAWKMVDEDSVGAVIKNNFRQIPTRHILHIISVRYLSTYFRVFHLKLSFETKT